MKTPIESSLVWQDGRWVLACALLATVVFALDVFVPVATAGGVPYIVVIMVCLWSPRRRSPLVAAAVCSLLTVAGYFLAPAVGEPSQAVVDRLLALLAIWATALLVLRRKEDLREHERRLREQMAVLVELAQNKAIGLGDLDDALREITEAAATVLQTERVGVWLLTGDGSRLRCIELFERTPRRHTMGMELEAEKYPNYFVAIEKERVIPANQADVDLRTCEFRETYLGPLGIASMLDAGIRLRGQMIGVVCHEHVGAARYWTVEEQNFAGSIADFVGLAIEASERRRAEHELRKHRDRLEELVGVRTQELTDVNEQLTAEIAERNLAQQRMAQQADELARSNAELERFAYVASHDLQEPLRAVAGHCRLLERRYADRLDREAGELIQHAVEGASRMKALIDGLLTYSRASTRGLELTAVDCESVLTEALANLQASIAEALAVVTHDELPVVRADRTQMVELLQNLLSNSIKYRGERRPEIHVRAESQNGQWVFSVRDNGIGIAKEYRERIFTAFQRLHTRDEYPGTGIGLAICKRIVERVGGRIWAESQPGEGSTFFFTVPAEPSP